MRRLREEGFAPEIMHYSIDYAKMNASNPLFGSGLPFNLSFPGGVSR